MLIRPATPADAAHIALHRYPDETDCSQRPPYADWVRGALGRGVYIGQLVVDGPAVIAGAGLILLEWGPNRTDPNPLRARLVNVWTHADYRRRGLARQLTTDLLNQAKGRGIRTVSLGTTDMGKPLYEGLGFRTYPHEMLLNLEGFHE